MPAKAGIYAFMCSKSPQTASYGCMKEEHDAIPPIHIDDLIAQIMLSKNSRLSAARSSVRLRFWLK